LLSLEITVLMVTHDLPYALELCPRSVVLFDGTIVADGETRTVLSDEQLMKAHRLSCRTGSTRAGCRGRPRELSLSHRAYLGCSGPAPSMQDLQRTRPAGGIVSSATRTPDEISTEIAEVRNRLAGTIDKLVYRVKPKTILQRQLDTTKASFENADGSLKTDMVVKVVGIALGAVATIIAIRKIAS